MFVVFKPGCVKVMWNSGIPTGDGQKVTKENEDGLDEANVRHMFTSYKIDAKAKGAPGE